MWGRNGRRSEMHALLKETREDVSRALGLKRILTEAGYLDDPDIADALSVVASIEKELASEVYDAIASGVPKTIRRLVEERDEERTYRAKHFPTQSSGALPYTIASIASSDGFGKVLKRGSDLACNEYATYGRDERNKAKYNKRIKTLQHLEQMLEEGEGATSDVQNRLLQLATKVSGSIQILDRMRALIDVGEDPRSIAAKQELSMFFEPMEY